MVGRSIDGEHLRIHLLFLQCQWQSFAKFMEVVASTLQNFGSNNCFLILAYSSYSSTVPRKSMKKRIEEDQFWRSKHIGLMDPMDLDGSDGSDGSRSEDVTLQLFHCTQFDLRRCDVATQRRKRRKWQQRRMSCGPPASPVVKRFTSTNSWPSFRRATSRDGV